MDLIVADAFTDRAFAGNPAAVAFLDDAVPGAWPPEPWMQALAAEMNLSETAFVTAPGPDGARGLRWVTPAVEVPLCGHATLASAHALAETGRLAPARAAAFDTASGRLTVTPRPDGAWTLDLPALAAAEAPAPSGLAAVLGQTPVWYGRTGTDGLAVLPSADAVRALAPDPAAVAALGVRALIVTAAGRPSDAPDDDAPRPDVVSRFFAPGAGIAEDPVTGSAHAALGPFWAARLGRGALACEQASARGGTLAVAVAGDRVHLTGRAVTILRATLTPAARPR